MGGWMKEWPIQTGEGLSAHSTTHEWNFVFIHVVGRKCKWNVEMKYILISPTPSFSGVKGGFTCQEEWYRPSWAISPLCFAEVKKSEWFASNSVPISKIEKFLLANPKVSYLDTFSVLCPDIYCKNHDQHSFMYRDRSHLTSYGAMKLSNTIETFIRSQ